MLEITSVDFGENVLHKESSCMRTITLEVEHIMKELRYRPMMMLSILILIQLGLVNKKVNGTESIHRI